MPRLKKLYKTLQDSSEGMTLIEVIIALAILGLVAVTFLVGVSTALKATSLADERATAQSLVQSQMEYAKSQGYITDNDQAEYLKLGDPPDTTVIPTGYSIRSLDRAGYTTGDTVDEIMGVPWDPEASPPVPSTDDNGIQKVTIIIYHPYDPAHPDDPTKTKKVFTLEDYKVDR